MSRAEASTTQPKQPYLKTVEAFRFGPNVYGVKWVQLLSTGVATNNKVRIEPRRGTEFTIFTRCSRGREDPYGRLETQMLKAFGRRNAVDKYAGGDNRRNALNGLVIQRNFAEP